MEFLTTLAENWQQIAAGGIVALAAFGKLAEIAIKTFGNIRDTYRETFPKPWIVEDK